MGFRHVRTALVILFFVFSIFPPEGNLLAQAPTGGLSGVVTDPSGGTIAKAAIRLTDASGASLDATTNREGFYEFKGLLPGTYSLKAAAKGFALFTQDDVQILAGQVQKLNIALVIQMEEEKVEVSDSSTKVDIAPSNNAGMVVMQGKDLEALSDDPDELQSELQTLAGPSAGPNGGQMYIDGFTAGTLPPKASIREIRINQNPFSAEYDKLGYGRIEILTKPGTDQFHGQAYISGTTAAFNARNPFSNLPAGIAQPGNDSEQYSGNIGGPLSKKASFFFNVEGRKVIDLKIVNTPFVDPTTFQIVQFSDAVPNPGRRYEISPRLDYQLTPTNTLTARYQYFHNTDENEGTGQFSLANQGFNIVNAEHTLQISDTQVVNAKIINETRFQFLRTTETQTPVSTTPTIQVQGAFTSGGNVQGVLNDALNRYELQNYTSMAAGKHFVKFGVRVRSNHDENFETANFNGNFSFGSRVTPPPSASCTGPNGALTGIQAYQQLVMGLANGQTVQSLINCGYGPTEYSVSVSPAGNPTVHVNWFDAGLYAQDDWRVRPNLTLSYGLRFETQNDISDHADLAPRIGIAWGIGGSPKKPPKTVLRAGFGMFYDRFGYDLVAQQQRLNGLIQQQFIVKNPGFYVSNTPPPSQLQQSGAPSTSYEPNSHLRAPYTMQTGVSLERQLGKSANLAVTYLNARGVHEFFTNNINAPDPANNGLRPLPAQGNIYQYQSDGVFRQNQLIVNSSIRMGTKLSAFGYYTLNYANSDTGGPGYFPSNPYDPSEDYGRASFDVRHRVFIGGFASLPYAFRLSPFMIATSGSPFNVTAAQDPFGDQVFNQRAAFATCPSSSPTVKPTPYGCFDWNPQPGEKIVPINFLTGRGKFTLNLRLSKTFGFGKKAEATNTGPGGGPGPGGTFGRGPGGGGPGQRGGFGGRGPGGPDGNSANHRYSLTFSVAARNIFNNVNRDTPIGNLSSSLFGQSNGLAGRPFSQSTSNRRIDLQATFSF
ncbi:MAG TPA: carboxypeptidase regulatory-like domain-containing protein [Candidatus Acidoferrum sp.]|nr:carboxypeptidase regulatory-like domain-containing protein [Candidatus Acidoferrum sp.]